MTFFSSSPRQYSFFCHKYSTFFHIFLLSFRHRIKTVNLKFKFTFSAVRLRRYRGDEKTCIRKALSSDCCPVQVNFCLILLIDSFSSLCAEPQPAVPDR